MDIKIRSDEELYMKELKKWLREESETPLEEMSGFFERRIDGYEDHMSLWKDAYLKMAQIIPAHAHNILDLGCGTGLELDEIFKLYPDINVTGIDLCSVMLNRLKEKHKDKNINLICEDYFAADFGNEIYDLVISFESLHHFTLAKKKGLYKKIYEALKCGGTFMECDYLACCDEEEALLFSEYQRKRSKSLVSDKAFVHFDIPLTAEHEMEAMTSAGFRAEVIDCINGAVFIRADKV